MLKKEITAQELFNELCKSGLYNEVGEIKFELAGVSVKISTTDTVGITLQSWLKQYLIEKNYVFEEPVNTQEFPDFYLGLSKPTEKMLEVKSFNYSATPAFDIANFESYCVSIVTKPYRLNADYLIFGYTMNSDGNINIRKIWLHKIWEIAGVSERFAVKTQVKRGMIYNLRPNSEFKRNVPGPFKDKDQFLYALYITLIDYKGSEFAENWKDRLKHNYKDYFNSSLPF